MVALTGPQTQALIGVQRAWPEADIAVVGAVALSTHIELSYRRTDDLDLVLALDMEQFPGPLPRMAGWQQHRSIEHRFYSPEGQEVDVLPVSMEAIERGYIEWPSGTTMNLMGFDLVFKRSVVTRVGPVEIHVPNAPVIVLLKMRAWLDRPAERRKDLQDLAHLLTSHVGDDDDRRWSEEAVDSGLDFEEIAPFLMGLDLGQLLDEAHNAHVEEFVARVPRAAMATLGPPSWRSVDDAERAMDAFCRGLAEGRRRG